MTAVAVPLIRCVTCRSGRVRQISYHSSREARQQKRGEGGVAAQAKQAQEQAAANGIPCAFSHLGDAGDVWHLSRVVQGAVTIAVRIACGSNPFY